MYGAGARSAPSRGDLHRAFRLPLHGRLPGRHISLLIVLPQENRRAPLSLFALPSERNGQKIGPYSHPGEFPSAAELAVVTG